MWVRESIAARAFGRLQQFLATRGYEIVRRRPDDPSGFGDNPAAVRIKLPDRPSKRVEAYTWDEARAILEHLPSPIYEMAFLSITTSLNVAELCGLRVGRVNLGREPRQIDGEVVSSTTIRGRLAEVSTQMNDLRSSIPLRHSIQRLGGAVRAAVIAEDDFVVAPEFLQKFGELSVQRVDVVQLIIDRDDD